MFELNDLVRWSDPEHPNVALLGWVVCGDAHRVVIKHRDLKTGEMVHKHGAPEQFRKAPEGLKNIIEFLESELEDESDNAE